ncbi:uncharacterized protein LOC107458000 [Arachis duranensis]|uniref:Uncharacterized protein LOC107458000 n=1 Tax=Arachis duranensis TaxID=130453 RepID=A0A6P4BVF4_ARADU|nr:uncharacterized protein LOC107458000 [Arachis duranensis]
MGGASTSMPVVAASGSIPDPSCVAAGIDGAPPGVPNFEVEARPDRVENAMRDDDSDDELVDIGRDNDDDILSNTHTPHGTSGSVTDKPLFYALNLEVVGQQQNVEAIFVGQGLHDANALVEFQICQSFQNKEEVVLSVKGYGIRRGVESRVMESDHLKYHGSCKEFGKECTWMIRITLWQRKSTWKVRRYNELHTCLATSISSDYRQLDYHVIYARIFPLVRANASVTIKVL